MPPIGQSEPFFTVPVCLFEFGPFPPAGPFRLDLRVRTFRVRRDAELGECRLTDVFGGLESSASLQKVFGSKAQTAKVLEHLKLRVEPNDSGLWLDKETGTVCVGVRHLTAARGDFMYLDAVHVLVHVRQFLEGRDLYDQAFEYVERPTELEAYRYTVAEARKVGMDNEEILRYLRMDAADDSELGRLMEKIGVRARR